MKFILGYDINDNGNFETLTQYKTTKEADYNTEEWCIVEAKDVREAKSKYEQTFTELKEKGFINGCM
jgi:hypothetical protein